jgi:excisionase family DNA binding protein
MTVWLKTAQAADYANVTPEVIRQHVRSRLLPAYAIGTGRREYRIRAEDVDHWLETRPWNQYREGPP